MNLRDKKVRIRMGLCLVGLLSALILLMARSWQLQFLADSRISRMEEKQAQGREVLSTQRGTIFDQTGKVLAVNLQVPSIFADPSSIDDPQIFARRVGVILSIPPRQILLKIKDTHRKFVWLKRKADPAVEKKLNSLELAGLHILHEGKRLYPDRQLASQLVGFVGVDGDRKSVV